THLERRRLVRFLPDLDQWRCRRPVGGVSCRELICERVVAGDATGPLHQLCRALWLPRMFLFAHQLHTDRTPKMLGQQRSLGRSVVGAVAPVTTRGFHPNDANLFFAGPAGWQCPSADYAGSASQTTLSSHHLSTLPHRKTARSTHASETAKRKWLGVCRLRLPSGRPLHHLCSRAGAPHGEYWSVRDSGLTGLPVMAGLSSRFSMHGRHRWRLLHARPQPLRNP